jgi:hypothetical protein
MATRHFDDASLGAFPESIFASTLLMSGYSAPLRLIRPLPAATALRGQQPLEADTNNMGRCIRWALAIEGGTALAIYAIYVLVRLVM